MRVIPPVVITDAKLMSHTVPEPAAGEQSYQPLASYLAGDEVISPLTHKKYMSLQGAQSAVTISIGSPGVITWPDHGLLSGQPVVLATTGTLPVLIAGTTYYAVVFGKDTIGVASTAGGAAINTTGGSQSGIHTAKSNVNVGHPLPVPPEKENDWWIESGVTNRFAAFDLERNTKTVGPSPMTIKIAPGERVDTIACLGVDADSISVTATSGGVQVYSNLNNSLLRRRVNDMRDFFFEPFDIAPSFVAFDVPLDGNLEITVEIVKASGEASIGSLVVGRSTYIGETQYNAESDALNFSKVERDEFGSATLVPRRSVPKTRQTLFVEKARVGKLFDLRKKLNAVPAVWCGIDDGLDDYFEPLLILGIYKQFTINVAHPTEAIVNLELEEI